MNKAKRRLLAAVAVLVLGSGVVTERLFVHPPLAAVPPVVDAIIELGGPGMAGRDSVALELARSGRAPYVVQSTLADAEGTSRCLPPVPDVTVLCFHAEPNSTRGEARWIAAEAERRQWRSVVLVTTPDQAWRARLRTTRCFDGDVYVVTAPLPSSEWPRQIPYQWGATAKALTLERSC